MLAMQSNPKYPDKDEAIDAIGYILQRVKESSDFAWYMLHTDSLRKCVDAWALAKSIDADALHKKITDAAVLEIKKHPPQVEALRAERDELQEEVNAATDYVVDNGYSSYQLEELLNFCRLRNERPTVEAIETALAGKSLACCLGHM